MDLKSIIQLTAFLSSIMFTTKVFNHHLCSAGVTLSLVYEPSPYNHIIYLIKQELRSPRNKD